MMMFEKDNSNSGGEPLCVSCYFRAFDGYCMHDGMYHTKVGVCKDYQDYKEKDNG